MEQEITLLQMVSVQFGLPPFAVVWTLLGQVSQYDLSPACCQCHHVLAGSLVSVVGVGP